jgi:hypothetical protein
MSGQAIIEVRDSWRRWIPAASVVGVLAVLLVSSMAAGATSAPALASPPQSWSHLEQRWYNNTTTRTFGNTSFTYNISAFFGVHDVVTATNTSNTTTLLQGLRWENATLIASWCVPNCSAPLYRESAKVRGLELESQFLNMTTNASVNVNGSTRTALGITNASARETQTLTEMTLLSWGNRTATAYFNESQLAYFGVQFQPSLGLIPWNLSANLTWNSSSGYRATGGWNDSFSYAVAHNGTTYGRSGTFSGQLNRTGHESIRGKDFGTTTSNNRSVVWIGLRSHGPLNFDGDLFMTAIGSDLFQGATANWTVNPDPAYESAGVPLSSVYAQKAAAPTSSDSAGSGTTGGTSGGTSTTTGGSNGAPTGTQAPRSSTPVLSPGSPTSSTPSPGPSTVGKSPHTGGWNIRPLLPMFGLLGAFGALGAIAVLARRRRSAP